ncbi:hypothetical protein CTRC46_03805 [Chlamydia trachomatis RC-L2(s)/46]|nr:hypothetical protein CTRC46_03805 [Chlamydia trachomatis RC-L2(s)/46]
MSYLNTLGNEDEEKPRNPPSVYVLNFNTALFISSGSLLRSSSAFAESR